MKKNKIILIFLLIPLFYSFQFQDEKIYYYLINQNDIYYYQVDFVSDNKEFREITSYLISKDDLKISSPTKTKYRVENENLFIVSDALKDGEQLLLSVSYVDSIIKVTYDDNIVNSLLSLKSMYIYSTFFNNTNGLKVHAFIQYTSLEESYKLIFYDENFILYKSHRFVGEFVYKEIERIDDIPIELKNKLKIL